jgi:D-alanine-D-alanine ligase
LGYALKRAGKAIITPDDAKADPANDKSWTFPDTVEGIRAAIDLGANTLWANTVLHSQHPLVTMKDELAKKSIRMVGQSPTLTERWDDKASTNLWLAKQQGLEGAFPKSRIIEKGEEESLGLEEDGIGWPRILKPIRGRGSHGVAVIKDEAGFREHLETLFKESGAVLVEVSHQ